jgi:dipeptidyl aminopeptidase/acylaminoacyl peptidase
MPLFVIFLVLAFGSCASSAAEGIDVRAFARAPAMAQVSLSPDGAWLAFVAQADGRQFVVLRSLKDGSERTTLDVLPRRERVRWCDWAGSIELLCGTVLPHKRPDRIAETTRLYVIQPSSGRVRELAARLPDAVRDRVIDFSAQRSGHVLLMHDPVGQGYPEVSQLDLSSGALRRLVSSTPPIREWLSDGRGNVRLGLAHNGSSTAALYTLQNGEWKVFREQSLRDPQAVGPLAFGEDHDVLYVLRHHEGRVGLFEMNLRRDEDPRMLFVDPIYDVAGPLIQDSRSRRLLGVRYVAEREEQRFFDASAARLQTELDRALPDATNLVADMSADAQLRLVQSYSDIDPPSWYLHDVQAGSVELVGHQYPELEDVELVPTRAVTYSARDGQRIPAYLTVPARRRVLSAIVLPHGGPETRNYLGFDPLVQFLAAQGHAVLQMNFRGSFGYGAGFAAAGVGQWGAVIHNDITDGARWLVAQKLVDPARMCIVGQSFGGYAALLGAARESQWYACAASYAGISDLLALSQYAQRLQSAAVWNERLGTNAQALWQMSPMTKVRAIEIPVLLMHGRNDPVVPVSQSRRLARELRAEGKSHRYLERVDCDHELTIESCRTEFFTELQRFLLLALPP